MRQIKSKQQHALCAQSFGLLHDILPMHFTVMADQFGDITDPPQSLPEIFGTLHTEG